MNWYNHYRIINSCSSYQQGGWKMELTPGLYSSASRPGYLAEVTLALLQICDTRASGRLSIRNEERFGLAHLYFKQACLVHVAGDKRDGESTLNDLLTWSKGKVRFDPSLMVNYESVTWQQAQIFSRWLAFLEMRGAIQGIPQTRLEGFVHSLIEHLPVEPIAFPQQITNLEEYEKEALARQWQRVGEDIHHLIERALPGVGQISQNLARRAVNATWQGLRQAGEATSEAAKHTILHADEIMRHTFDKDRRQQIIQSTQHTVESVRQSVSQTIEQGHVQPVSPGTQPVRVESIRPVSPATTGPANGR